MWYSVLRVWDWIMPELLNTGKINSTLNSQENVSIYISTCNNSLSSSVILQAWPQWTWQRHLFQCGMAHIKFWHRLTVPNLIKCMELPTLLLNSEKVFNYLKRRNGCCCDMFIMISDTVFFFMLLWKKNFD